MTAREQVDALLDGYPPVDEREAASIARIRHEMARLDAPFDQRADLVHVTGSAIVAGPRGVLLLVHRKLGFWMQPGGHLEPGEDPATAAAREAHEETGIVVAHPRSGPCFVHADVHEASESHVHLDLRFLLHAAAAADDPRPPPGESQQVRWFGWDDAAVMADDSLRGALQVARVLSTSMPIGDADQAGRPPPS